MLHQLFPLKKLQYNTKKIVFLINTFVFIVFAEQSDTLFIIDHNDDTIAGIGFHTEYVYEHGERIGCLQWDQHLIHRDLEYSDSTYGSHIIFTNLLDRNDRYRLTTQTLKTGSDEILVANIDTVKDSTGWYYTIHDTVNDFIGKVGPYDDEDLAYPYHPNTSRCMKGLMATYLVFINAAPDSIPWLGLDSIPISQISVKLKKKVSNGFTFNLRGQKVSWEKLTPNIYLVRKRKVLYLK